MSLSEEEKKRVIEFYSLYDVDLTYHFDSFHSIIQKYTYEIVIKQPHISHLECLQLLSQMIKDYEFKLKLDKTLSE